MEVLEEKRRLVLIKGELKDLLNLARIQVRGVPLVILRLII